MREVWARLVAGGVGSLFRGLGVHSLLETVGSGCYLVSYAATKQAVARRAAARGGPVAAEEPLSVRIGCGMVAGCCGWLSIYPLDVLRSRVMSVIVPGSGGSSNAFSLVAGAARDTYASGGLLAFYRGLGFTLLRAAPVAGTVLPVYDVFRGWLARVS